LAQRYNVEIEETVVSDEVKLQQQVAESLHALNNFAQKFFSEQLFSSKKDRAMRSHTWKNAALGNRS
jgi:DNA primase